MLKFLKMVQVISEVEDNEEGVRPVIGGYLLI
jgi:hypothetical protein